MTMAEPSQSLFQIVGDTAYADSRHSSVGRPRSIARMRK
jgi:hypothetical protein